jgi:inner membrane protein YidH
MSSAKLPQADVLAGSAPQKSNDATRLALSRTILAHDRTLMAWVRTSTSMISFGFTIYKFFQFLQGDQTSADVHRLLGPRGVALVMILIGVSGLLLATIDYRRQIAVLRRDYQAYGPIRVSTALALATMVAGLGVLGFVLVLLRQ